MGWRNRGARQPGGGGPAVRNPSCGGPSAKEEPSPRRTTTGSGSGHPLSLRWTTWCFYDTDTPRLLCSSERLGMSMEDLPRLSWQRYLDFTNKVQEKLAVRAFLCRLQLLQLQEHTNLTAPVSLERALEEAELAETVILPGQHTGHQGTVTEDGEWHCRSLGGPWWQEQECEHGLFVDCVMDLVCCKVLVGMGSIISVVITGLYRAFWQRRRWDFAHHDCDWWAGWNEGKKDGSGDNWELYLLIQISHGEDSGQPYYRTGFAWALVSCGGHNGQKVAIGKAKLSRPEWLVTISVWTRDTLFSLRRNTTAWDWVTSRGESLGLCLMLYGHFCCEWKWLQKKWEKDFPS